MVKIIEELSFKCKFFAVLNVLFGSYGKYTLSQTKQFLRKCIL